MVIALVLVLGGGPSGGRYDEYWGARTWYVDYTFPQPEQNFPRQ